MRRDKWDPDFMIVVQMNPIDQVYLTKRKIVIKFVFEAAKTVTSVRWLGTDSVDFRSNDLY